MKGAVIWLVFEPGSENTAGAGELRKSFRLNWIMVWKPVSKPHTLHYGYCNSDHLFIALTESSLADPYDEFSLIHGLPVEEETDQHIRKGLAPHSLDYLHAEYPDALNRHRVLRQ